MNIIKIFPPVVSQFFVDVSQDATIDLQFRASEASYQRSDNDVVITLDDGASIVLLNFFLTQAGEHLPIIKDESGQEMDGGAFLHKFNPSIPLDIVVEPEQENILPSSGGGSYKDYSGDIISGLDRAEALAAAPGESSGNLPVFEQMEATSGQLGEAPSPHLPLPPNPSNPSNPSTPSVPDSSYLARAVAYAATSSASARFRLLDANGLTVADSTAETFSASSENDYFDVNSISLHPDGSISYSLSAKGVAALAAAAGADIFDYITLQYDGRAYTMQVLINSSGNYSPASAEADGRPHPGLGGEWHYANVVEAQGQKAGSSGNDGMWFYNAATPGSGTAFTGSLTFNGGNNSFSAEGGEYGVSDAQISSGSGADIIYMHGGSAGLANSSVNTGSGADSVKISSDENAIENSAQSSVIAHKGSVELSVNNASGQATGIYSSGSGATVNIEAPKISINIDADTGSAIVGAYSALGSQVNLGSGSGANSSLSIDLHNSSGPVYGLYAYANNNADASSIKLEKVTAQPGKALINVNSESSNAYAINNWKSEVALSGDPANTARTNISAESGGNVAYTVYGAYGNTSLSGFQDLHISADCDNDLGWAAPLLNTGNSVADGIGKMYLADIASLTLSSHCSGWAAYGINNSAYTELGAPGAQIGELIIDAHNSNTGIRSNHSHGISSNNNGELHLTAGRLDINAHADTGDARGINAENGGHTFISSDGALDISINVSGPSTAANMDTTPYNLTYGIYADPNGNPNFAGNTITGGQAPGQADIITLTGGGVMAYRGGSNNITTGNGDDVLTLNSIEAIGRGLNSGYVRSYNNINMGAGNNTLKASIKADYDAENNIIFSGGGNNLIYGGDIVSGGNNTASKNHIYNEDAASSFNLTIGQAGAPVDIRSGNRGDNIINTAAQGEVDSIIIHGSLIATHVAYSSSSPDYYGNTISSNGGQDYIEVKGSLTSSNYGFNRIESGADNDNINIGGGLTVQGRSENTIDAGAGDDSVFIAGNIIASGGYYGASIYSSNNIKLGEGNNSLDIQGRLEATTYGRNYINAGDDNDKVNIEGGLASAGSAGVNSIDLGDGQNTLDIDGGLSAKNRGQNIITLGDDGDILTITGGLEVDGSGNASNRPVNLINTGAGDDIVNIDGGLYATNWGVNSIETGSGSDTVFVNGDITRGSTNASNSISTGDGDDIVLINGSVAAGALTLNMGAGSDILVLEATDHTEFTNYYQAWLNTAVLDGVESIQVRMDSGGLGDLGWLVTYANNNSINLDMAPPISPFSLGQSALFESMQLVNDDNAFMLSGSPGNTAADWAAQALGYDLINETQLEIMRQA